MNTIAKNILNEVINRKTTSFTKEEIIKLINDVCNEEQLPIIESNGVIVDPETLIITYKGKNNTIPKKEFQLLYYLMANKNKLRNRHQILKEVWGKDIFVGERTIDVHIRRIRTIIPNTFIKTNKGVGYCWVEK